VNAWQKLPRLVRELSLELDKKIELDMIGADTELDRQVLEMIKDPLTHMIRNSADHGIESPAERVRTGKSEIGRIKLSAYQQGGYIVIEVADDGRGLDAERIRAKAHETGLSSLAELDRLSDSDTFKFIFRPGFSTASAVSGVSGRGVGMDVVRNNIELIGGTVELKSTSQAGTTFVIKIPLTLAIMAALIV
ncbi:MAG: chemotaxis protein CheA, partial [Steroidobacteraceae bacterium]